VTPLSPANHSYESGNAPAAVTRSEPGAFDNVVIAGFAQSGSGAL
jgi:hypothetical protein